MVSEDTRSKDTKRYGTWNRRRIYNEGRTGALRRWLISVFGIEYLSSGSGIIDVAGGKGELSFEIVNLNHIPATVIDPRPLSLTKFKRKLAYGFFHKNEVLNTFNTVSSEYCSVISACSDPRLAVRQTVSLPRSTKKNRSAATGTGTSTGAHTDSEQAEATGEGLGSVEDKCAYHPPKHIRNFFEVTDLGSGRARLAETGAGGLDESLRVPRALLSPDSYSEANSLAVRTAWTNKGLQTHEDEEEEEAEAEEVGDASVGTGEGVDEVGTLDGDADASSSFVGDVIEAQNIVRRCSAVVGMHPDQAAEHIVEFGLRNSVPFAVIPCCVYSKQFPHRTAADGHLVRSYGEFIEYLLAKDPRIGAVEMDFDGKNVMLYFLADVAPLTPPGAVAAHICRGPATPASWWKLSTSPRCKSRAQSIASSEP